MSTEIKKEINGNPYFAIFHAKGSFAFFFTSFIARFPISMVTLAMVVMITAKRDAYTLPSLVATSYILANALFAPQLSRLADLYGQSRIALLATCIETLSFVTMIMAVHFYWPDWSLFAAAIGAGFGPSFGAFSRARWAKIYSGTPLLRTAFALESLAEEIVFMSGPPIVLLLATGMFPEAGLAAAAILLLMGALPFSTLKNTEPAPASNGQKTNKPAIFNPSVLFLSLTLLAFGGIFGVLEVTTVAFTKKFDIASLAFYPLSAAAIGSFISGLGYGALRWKMALSRQLLVMTFILGLTTLPFFFVSNIWALTAMCFVLGVTCSPSMIIAMGLIEELVEKSRLTESMTWAVIGANVGLASGFLLAGPIIDAFGPEVAFYGMVLFGCSTFCVVVVAQPKFQKPSILHPVLD